VALMFEKLLLPRGHGSHAWTAAWSAWLAV
jgi:hypothetical protein